VADLDLKRIIDGLGETDDRQGYISKLSTGELLAIQEAERRGDARAGDLPIRDEIMRQKALDSPYYFATEIVDPYYKKNFEPMHKVVLDDVIRPYMLGQELEIEGQVYDPAMYLGMVMLFSRDTWKSSMMWMTALWSFLYMRIRHDFDVRAMYVHQVLKKAVKRGENLRDAARHNQEFRRCFPDYRSPPGEWDTKEEWSWPNFRVLGAGESSFTAYGESSDKTGGHYTHRFVDDWETDSLKTPQAREDNYAAFLGMDPLKDRTVDHSPYLIAGTTYSFEGTQEKLARDGGYIVWKIPACKGSPKALFDMCSLDPRIEKEKKKIERGIRKLEKERSDDLNFPNRLPWKELYLNARGQGPHVFACQMLLNPVPEGDARFSHETLDNSWVKTIPDPANSYIYVRCDPAISRKKHADDTAYIVGLVSWDGRRYLVDGWIGRENQPHKIIQKGFHLAKKWKNKGYVVKSIGYESVAYQEGLAQSARYGVPEREADYDGEAVSVMTKPCPVVSIKRKGDMTKQERIISMDGPLSRGELLFWKECGIAERAMKQMKQYPHGKDDILDAMHDLWEKTTTPPREIEEERSGLHPALLAIINQNQLEDGPIKVGSSNTIKLASWG
jgi:hypothetical protein